MTQATDWSVPLTGPVSPDVMADRMDKSFDALLSSHSGASRPTYAVAGTRWASTATAGKIKYYEFDGVADRLIKTIDTATGQVTYADVDGRVVYASKSGNYTALATDNNAVHRFTAAAMLSLTAAATLGTGWHYTVVADGGVVTIDPNGSETINGVATVTIPNGSSATIICDGTNFYSYIKAAAWEAIGDYTLSAASLLDVTNLAAYRKLRITGVLTMSASSNALVRFSTDNGASFDASGANYPEQALFAVGATVTGILTNLGGAALFAAGVDANFINSVNTNIESFNKATRATLRGGGSTTVGGALSSGVIDCQYLGTTARNAIRIVPSSGTMTGNLMIEGVRG